MTLATAEHFDAWIRDASGPDRAEELGSAWDEFASHEQPVATLFGAFDTGKSSILRRLLVDSGQSVPDWLTVSARHETFTDRMVAVGGCLVRDTPGLSPDGTDARSVQNSHTARTTVGLTDVLLVTLNPQLATGERPELLEILAQEWPVSTVWFLISRADEGGVDPTADPAGFEDWSERKRRELRSSLGLDDESPIHVLIPDFGQLGAFESDPSPETWDLSREWDGMNALASALRSLSDQDVAGSRQAAERRFWRTAVTDRLTTIRTDLADLKTSRDSALNSLRQKQLFMQQVDSLTDAARLSLEGAINDAVRRVLQQPDIDAAAIERVVDPVLEQWWREQHAAIMRIRQDALTSFDQQRSGKGWAAFGSLYESFSAPKSDASSRGRTFTPRFERLGREAVDALKAIDDLRRANEKRKKNDPSISVPKDGAEGGLDLGEIARFASAVLPLAIEFAAMLEDGARAILEKEQARAERRRIEEEITRVVREAAEQVMQQLAPDADALRQEVSEQTIGESEVDDLTDAVREAEELVARAEALLK